MRKFRYLNHTADIEFRSYGSSAETAIRNSFLALFDTIAYTKRLSRSKGAKRTAVIKVSADSLEELIWKALQAAVSIGDARGQLFFDAMPKLVKKKGGKLSLRAELIGKDEKSEYAKFYVKGVSRFNLSATHKGGKYAIDVVVDV